MLPAMPERDSPAETDAPSGSPAGRAERSSDAEEQAAVHSNDSAASHRRRVFRSRFHRWFFSTDRRYQMFQTIVGTTIANLLAAGIIAGIAVTSGNLRVSFSWSWRFFWDAMIITAGLGLLEGIFITISYHKPLREGESSPGWLASVAFGLYTGIFAAFLLAFIVTFFDALSFSIVHAAH
jgi:hypothetical protein